MPGWTLEDKVVLITGGSRGIGAATARKLSERGAHPVLAATNAEALAATARAMDPQPLTVQLDITSLKQCEAAVEKVMERHGKLDIAWANAGIASGGPMLAMSPEAWKYTIDVNVMGAYNTIRAALPAVIERQGYVAVSASIATFIHGPGMSAYSATKAAVEAMCNSLRLEVAHLGVDVGTIHPTFIDTDMVREAEGNPAFDRIRSALPTLFRKSYPADRAAADIVKGFARRRRRIPTPWFVQMLQIMRPVLTTRPMEWKVRKMAPELEAIFTKEIEERGLEAACLGDRVAAQMDHTVAAHSAR